MENKDCITVHHHELANEIRCGDGNASLSEMPTNFSKTVRKRVFCKISKKYIPVMYKRVLNASVG
jgi:hypothetical protein